MSFFIYCGIIWVILGLIGYGVTFAGEQMRFGHGKRTYSRDMAYSLATALLGPGSLMLAYLNYGGKIGLRFY